MSTINDPFNPTSSYEPPKTDSAYLKFEKGQTEFLPLDSAVIGWEYWNIAGKPVRLREQPDNPKDLPDIRPDKDDKGNERYRVNHFWAFPVIDCASGRVKLLEITQKGIQADIRAYAKNSKWGNPVLNYTFTVNREGDGFDTEYTVMANPLREVPAEWVKAWREVQEKGFNIQELFEGGDPFKPTIVPEQNAPEAEEPQVQQPETAPEAQNAPQTSTTGEAGQSVEQGTGTVPAAATASTDPADEIGPEGNPFNQQA